MMIGQTTYNGMRPVQLLQENKPNHLVRECHRRQRYLVIGSVIDSFVKPIRAAYQEHQSLCPLYRRIVYIGGKLPRCVHLAVLIQ